MRPKVSNDAKPIHVLSFDGGGSRGLMEAIMIDEIMKLATIMRDNPEKLTEILKIDTGLETPETLKSLQEMVEKVQDPIHPTEVFQYIMGKFDYYVTLKRIFQE